MANKQRRTDTLLYEGFRHLYTGDLLYDAGTMLQNSVNAEEYGKDEPVIYFRVATLIYKYFSL